MRCPTLAELPSPLPSKTGWPWTTESEQSLDTMPNGSPWPLLSVVTPSLNQGEFIEETIRSVLLQGYANLEYIVIDGGSSDNSVEIIRKYEPWIEFWVSESDRGQSHAINKGFKRATGPILGWLNSDDTYTKGALQLASDGFGQEPDAALVYGICNSIDIDGNFTGQRVSGPLDLARLAGEVYFWQPAVFMRAAAVRDVGYLDEDLTIGMDWDLWIRISSVYSGVYLPIPLANARYWPGMRTELLAGDTPQAKRLILAKLATNDGLSRDVRSAIRAAVAVTYWKEGEMLISQGDRINGIRLLARALAQSPLGTWRSCVQGWLWMLLPAWARRAFRPTVRWALRRSGGHTDR